MPFELKIKDRTSKVEILEHKGNFYKVSIGDHTYEVDVTKVENGVYSLIYQGKSVNMEMIEGDASNKYIVNTRTNDYQVEIIDAKARYRTASKGNMDNDDAIISSPMPGKIVRLLVKQGDKVEKGDTVIIVSAMKMESEYKSPIDGTVKKIFVKADDTVEGNQNLVEIEPLEEN
ncbi:MAG: biotin/lipoyl-containing protein [Prolixibacteraceae bacterium]